MRVTLLSLLVTIGLCAGCTTSQIHRSVASNPLPKMDAFARANDYNVQQSDTNYLRVRKNVNWGMMLLLRRDRFVGEYNYGNGSLDATCWLEMRGLWGLMPFATTLELKPQFTGWAVTPFPRECANDMLRAGGMSPEWQ
jgi:hypothetical protein